MVSRLMINLHDPILHKSTGRDEPVVTSRTGHVSTIVLDSILFAPSTQADLGKSWYAHLVRFASCQYDVRYGIGYTGSASRKCVGANAARVRPANSRGISHTSTYAQIQPLANLLAACLDLRHQSGPALERATVARGTPTQIEYSVSETGWKGQTPGGRDTQPSLATIVYSKLCYCIWNQPAVDLRCSFENIVLRVLTIVGGTHASERHVSHV